MSESPSNLKVREFCAEYYGVAPDDVTSEQTDPIIRYLRDHLNLAPSDTGAWALDEEAQAAARKYLDGRLSGQILEEEDSTADPWDEFVAWARRFYEVPEFDEQERDYKLEIAENIRSAKASIEADAEDWVDRLKRAFGSPNNLTYFITHTRYLDWVRDHVGEARRALLALWDESAPLDGRVQAFCDSLREDIPTPGSRLEIASFLLLDEPTRYAIYRPTPIKTAAALVEYPSFPNEPEAAIYTHALEFLDAFIDEAATRGLRLRDRLDAQGLVWAVSKTKPEVLDWSDNEIEAFLQYRGERPSVWWVNQGNTYSLEQPSGVVSAGLKNKAGYVFQHHKNVSLLRKGDVIVHHAKGYIRAISSVTHKPEENHRPWDADGEIVHIAKTRYFELADPIEVRSLEAVQRLAEPGPFDKYGGVKQVYLVPLTPEFSGWLQSEYKDRWPEGSPWEAQQRATWLFQANPAVWDLPGHLLGMKPGDRDDFSVTRFKTEIAVGDRVLLWQSGPEAGLYGLATISGELFERAGDEEHFGNSADELAVPWRLDEKVEPPLLRTALLEHPVLKGLSVITAPQGSNFRVTDEQWVELRRLLDGDDHPEPEGSERSLDQIASEIASQGLILADRTLRRFHVSLRTRGFVILSGISGTGKTWLTEAYAEAVSARYLLVPVAPNWTTNEDLLGYLNPLDGVYHDTVFSQFLREAAAEYEQATTEQRTSQLFVLALDEMNLARVEYYFAKFLSAMEVRIRRGTADLEFAPNERVRLTPNLLFVGTVNVDETTHGFADKVFDRAQLIELEAPRDAIAAHIGSATFRDSLLDVYDTVADAKPFAFRVVDEVKAYVAESESLDVEWHEAIDEQILQKVLTKLTGADPAIRFALEQMVNLAEQYEFRLTQNKAQRMLNDYDRDGFTSYF